MNGITRRLALRLSNVRGHARSTLLAVCAASLCALAASGAGAQQIPNPNELPGATGSNSCKSATSRQAPGCDVSLRRHTDGARGWRQRTPVSQKNVCRELCAQCCDLYGGQDEIQRFMNSTACNCVGPGANVALKVIDCLGPAGEEVARALYGDRGAEVYTAFRAGVKTGLGTRQVTRRLDDFARGGAGSSREIIGEVRSGTFLTIFDLASDLGNLCEAMNDGIDEHFYIPNCKRACTKTYGELEDEDLDEGAGIEHDLEIRPVHDWLFEIWAGTGGTGLTPINYAMRTCRGGGVPGGSCPGGTLNSWCVCETSGDCLAAKESLDCFDDDDDASGSLVP